MSTMKTTTIRIRQEYLEALAHEIEAHTSLAGMINAMLYEKIQQKRKLELLKRLADMDLEEVMTG